ncbi:MAG: hypothetical protein SFU98_16685 [Leptospiraceae bacterium]|nr:hypothetical protein [Leptospiraceae bacterium]
MIKFSMLSNAKISFLTFRFVLFVLIFFITDCQTLDKGVVKKIANYPEKNITLEIESYYGIDLYNNGQIAYRITKTEIADFLFETIEKVNELKSDKSISLKMKIPNFGSTVMSHDEKYIYTKYLLENKIKINYTWQNDKCKIDEKNFILDRRYSLFRYHFMVGTTTGIILGNQIKFFNLYELGLVIGTFLLLEIPPRIVADDSIIYPTSKDKFLNDIKEKFSDELKTSFKEFTSKCSLINEEDSIKY